MNHPNSNNKTNSSDGSSSFSDEEIKAIDYLSNIETPSELNIKEAWNRVNERVSKFEEKKKASFSWLNFAASLVVFVIIGLLVAYFFSTHDEVHIAAVENNEEYSLPDASQVTLAKNSNIYYSKNFKEERELILNGAALFDVEEDKDHPFTIKTPGGTITVVGTSFYVTSRTRDIDIYVTSGVVSLAAGNREITIEKGKHAKYIASQNKIVVEADVDQNQFAWNTQSLEFDNQTLEYIARQIELYFEVEVLLTNDDIKNCKVTGTFQNPKLEDILSKIATVLDVKVKTISEDKIELRGKGC